MSFTSTPIAGGTTGTLADAAPAIDRISSVDYQRVKLTDATEGVTTGAGIDANPLVVKPRRRGTSDYDSGIVSVAASAPVQITASTIYPEGGWLHNTTTAVRTVALVNAADAAIFTDFALAPKNTIPLPFSPGMTLAGWKIGADAAGVRAQVWGAQ